MVMWVPFRSAAEGGPKKWRNGAMSVKMANKTRRRSEYKTNVDIIAEESVVVVVAAQEVIKNQVRVLNEEGESVKVSV